MLVLAVGISLLVHMDGHQQPTLRLRPWGENAIRMQVCRGECDDTLPGALGASPPGADSADRVQAAAHIHAYSLDGAITVSPVVNGNIRAVVDVNNLVTFVRVSDSKVLLKQTDLVVPSPETGGSVVFDASMSATQIYGMGQNRPVCPDCWMYDTRSLDVRNQTFVFKDIMGNEGGATNSAPYMIGGSKTAGGFSFGLLFNSPSFGAVQFNDEGVINCSTEPDSATGGNGTIRKQLDFLITTCAEESTPAEQIFDISKSYTAAVGRLPKMPSWGSLYWHCKNRYSTQEDLLTAARYFHKAGLDVGVLVVDWFHWKIMGDWSFDPQYWPDPQAMVDECRSYGIEIMVSVWPFTCETARSYNVTVARGYIASSSKGVPFGAGFGGRGCRLVDPSNPEFATYAWSLLKESYYKYGIKMFWLDNSEPWNPPGDSYFGKPNVSGSSGWSWADAGALFDVAWPKVFHDGLKSEGESDVILLPRAGWIGTWKYGASLWTGDIGSTMPILATSVKTVLSAQITGFGWMTIDGGGYCGGDSQSPAYRETQLRWMQLSLTLPIMRQHGQRDHTIFSYYGHAQEEMLKNLVRNRTRLQPYLQQELAKLASTGRPFNRPLNFDFPEDSKTWDLANIGLGLQNLPISANSLPATGDVIQAVPCSTAPAWSFGGKPSDSNRSLQLSTYPQLCLDSATATTACGYQRQCTPALWGCTFSSDGNPVAAHAWRVGQNNTLRNIRDAGFIGAQGGAPSGGEFCLAVEASSPFPTLKYCSTTDTNLQWVFNKNSQIENIGSGFCLGRAPPRQVVGIDQYMMGDTMMAAPVLSAGARSRKVYFPIGTSWTHYFTGEQFTGGSIVEIDAPLDHFPLFTRTDTLSTTA